MLVKVQTENRSIKIKVIDGNKEMFIVDKEITIDGNIGDEISIISVSEKLEGIKTEGLEYQLNDETLFFGSTRGISNKMNKTSAKIVISKGTALIEHHS